MIGSVLILDDIASARDWLRGAARIAFPEAEFLDAATLEETRKALQSASPDLFLCDLGLPDGSGLELLRSPDINLDSLITIVTTIHDEDEYLFPALRCGVHGYILKEHRQEEIAAMLTSAVAGNSPLSPSVARKILSFFQHRESGESVTLSRREEDVLRIAAKGYTAQETADMLGISQHTVREYLKSCYRKLKVSSRSEATLEAIRLGLIHP